MKILAVDQARHGAWAVYDYEGKKLLDYGTWGFDSKNYTFEQAILHIEALLSEVIRTHDIDAVFLEDIQLRKNVQSFKKLAQLQGVLVNMCEKTNILYNLVAPTQWQNYCKARGRTTRRSSQRSHLSNLRAKRHQKSYRCKLQGIFMGSLLKTTTWRTPR